MSEEPDPLDALIGRARTEIDAQIVAERRLIAPDFAAMVAAAHERDPQAVPAAAVAEAGSFAPVVEFGGSPVGDERLLSEVGLDRLIVEARELAEADVRERRLAGIPPLRGAEHAPRMRWLTPVLLLAAVVAGLALVGPRLMQSLAARGEGQVGVEAEYTERETSKGGDAQLRGVEGVPVGGAEVQRAVEASPVGEMPVLEAGEGADGSPREVEPAAKPSPDPRAKQEPRAKLGDRVAALDAEAQARWAAGDLDGAEQSFRAILAIAGKSRYGDLAYGDLFTLARQRGERAAETALWTEYLERFPQGRFAQDARAGSCRRAAAAERATCWQAYREDFPMGVHLREAERALAEETPG